MKTRIPASLLVALVTLALAGCSSLMEGKKVEYKSAGKVPTLDVPPDLTQLSRDDRYAVQVVQHVHVPREERKFLDQPQSKYEKKNWSSVMLFNAARCQALTPDYVNTASGLELHQFKWLGDDGLIGALPNRWNHLVGYDVPRADAALVHYTLGGPYFDEYRDCEYSEHWRRERDAMLATARP